MQRILFVSAVVFVCLAAQILCTQILGPGLSPNFILITIVFFNLYRGLRYGIGAAFLGGFLLDSFSGSVFGLNVFTFVMCSFLTGSLKMYIYQPGVAESRVLVILLVVMANAFLQFFVNLVLGSDLPLAEAFLRVIFPEMILTTLFANYTFERLKQCALRLFA